jgi:hypothetical protein
MDEVLAQLFGASMDLMTKWITPGKYVSGRELASAGIAELVEFDALDRILSPLEPLSNGSNSRLNAGRG